MVVKSSSCVKNETKLAASGSVYGQRSHMVVWACCAGHFVIMQCCCCHVHRWREEWDIV